MKFQKAEGASDTLRNVSNNNTNQLTACKQQADEKNNSQLPGKLRREQAVLDALHRYQEAHGYAPNFRELAAETGIRSISTISAILDRLEAQGKLRRGRSKSRGICVLQEISAPALQGLRGEAEEQKRQEEEIQTKDLQKQPADSLVYLPIIGTIAAGQPILAEEQSLGQIPLPASEFGEAGKFLLKVRGESMIDIGIFDGDYVVVQPASTADDGDIVVALVDDEATVKRFYRENGRYRLQPENSSMAPIYTDHVAVQGIVTDVIHHFGG